MNINNIKQNILKISLSLIIVGICISALGFVASECDINKFEISSDSKAWYRVINIQLD